MKNVISFLFVFVELFFFNVSFALIPLEGIIFGEVEDTKQFDPLKSILNTRFDMSVNGSEQKILKKSKYYFGVYKQGHELISYCEQNPSLNYTNEWLESTAARSVAATLQYIGLDKSLKAIAGYAKKLEYSDEEYLNLTRNLIANTCSQNLSVYSLKLLQSNFDFAWKKTEAINRSLDGLDIYFSADYKARQNTLGILQREFEYTLRNFRAFCSWGGDTSDFRMLVPYLKNPFIMSLIFNHLEKKKMSMAVKTNEIIMLDDFEGVQVACEDLICRKRTSEEFKRIFPRINGSTNLKDDLRGLYCEYFSRVKYQKNGASPQILKWIDEQTPSEAKVEALQFLSLLTGIPDGLIVADSFIGLEQFFIDNIRGRWDQWAEQKLKQFTNDHMYEEALEVKLIELAQSQAILKGEFQFLFDIGLSEIDKVLNEVDKIDTVFFLEMPVKYLAEIKERSEFLRKGAKNKDWERFYSRIVSRFDHQINLKKKLFKVPIWNDQISVLMADELISQLKSYDGKKLKRLSNEKYKIPVRMRFGIFALQYVRQKYKFKQNSQTNLTSK